ncbi:RpS4 [Cordylochernes scorpioides]|uniref:40S ribosomal protein S4 n=1 Tax=Cordylochernes scorpioides TaxID=51811 RepID=A0ABY6K4Z8_9ARAC|nr:RpS4 [Cordylochernes scorpioides]
MARGPKKHLKRLNAPKSWMLDKLGGVFAPRPSCGPHKLRQSFPLILILRNRLKYALTGAEVKKIVMQRLVKVDGKVRMDATYPAGYMEHVFKPRNCADVISIDKTGEHFRVLYDEKGRFILHRISSEEAEYKLCHVRKVNDTIQVDISTGKIMDYIKFDLGNMCMITGGHNLGRVGYIMSRERHQGASDIVHVKDANGHVFATRINYIFVIGKSSKNYVSLPRNKGLKLSVAEERDKRLKAKMELLA